MTAFALPTTLREIQRPGYALVGSAEPTDYERAIEAGSDWGTADVVWLLRQLLRRGGLLIDVGANLGLVTLPLARAGASVIACEMLPENCLKLQSACLLNGLHRVRVVQAAISSADCLIEYGGLDAWGKVGAGARQAVAMRLDTVMRLPDLPFRRRQVIKIDVEGHELAVLEGAVELIARRRPAIVFESIEFADRNETVMSQRCKRLLEQLGYRLFLQRGRVLVPRAASDLQEGLVADFLAVPREAPGWLRGCEVRDLTAEERAAWVAEMAVQQDAAHRRHAVAAIVKLREQGLDAYTASLIAPLQGDEDETVRTRALAAF